MGKAIGEIMVRAMSVRASSDNRSSSAALCCECCL